MFKRSYPKITASVKKLLLCFLLVVLVLDLMFTSLVHFKMILQMEWDKDLISLFHMWIHFPCSIYGTNHSFPIVLLALNCLEMYGFISEVSILSICMSIFYINIILFCMWYICSIFWNQELGCLKLYSSHTVLLWSVFCLFVFWSFHINFRIAFSISIKKLIEDLLGIAIKL